MYKSKNPKKNPEKRKPRKKKTERKRRRDVHHDEGDMGEKHVKLTREEELWNEYRKGDEFANTFLLYLASKHLNDCIPVLDNLNDNKTVVEYNYKNDTVHESDKEEAKSMNSSIFIAPEEQVLLIKKELEDKFLDCISSKARFILMLLNIVGPRSHSNILIFDTTKKTVERFDPQGWQGAQLVFGEHNDNMINTVIKKYVSGLGYIYISPQQACPKMQLGPQGFSEHGITDPRKRGFCQSWSMWYADYRLTFPNIKLNKINENMIKIYQRNPNELRTFIYNFTEFVYRNRARFKKNNFMKQLSEEYTKIISNF